MKFIFVILLTISCSEEVITDSYYKDLMEKCASSCCKASVRAMLESKGLLSHTNIVRSNLCPTGYKLNQLKCVDSHKWCEKK